MVTVNLLLSVAVSYRSVVEVTVSGFIALVKLKVSVVLAFGGLVSSVATFALDTGLLDLAHG